MIGFIKEKVGVLGECKLSISIRSITSDDQPWVVQTVEELLGGIPVVTPGGDYDPADIPGLIAFLDGERVGLLNYDIEKNDCEIVTLASTRPGTGVGSRLIAEVQRIAEEEGCNRLWLVTTNDNLHALGFYQKRGFRLVKIHHNAMDEVRRKKPAVPLIGLNSIPLKDMLELEIEI